VDVSGMEWVQVGWSRCKWNGISSSGMEWIEDGWNRFKWDGMCSSGMEWIQLLAMERLKWNEME
jgi:hypothetical protein